jgi:hypothetical protein
MYLGKQKEAHIREAVAEIKRLATMETCSLMEGSLMSAEAKEKIKGWVQWFDAEAKNILDVLDGRVVF